MPDKHEIMNSKSFFGLDFNTWPPLIQQDDTNNSAWNYLFTLLNVDGLGHGFQKKLDGLLSVYNEVKSIFPFLILQESCEKYLFT